MPSSTDQTMTEGFEDEDDMNVSTDSSTVGGVELNHEMPSLEEPDEVGGATLLDHYALKKFRLLPDRQPFFDDDLADKSGSCAKNASPNWDRASGGASRLKLPPITTDNLKGFFDLPIGPKNNSPVSDSSSVMDAIQRIIDYESQENESAEHDIEEKTSLSQTVEDEHVPVIVFHLFHKLPKKVRLMIWNLSCPDARLVELIEHQGNCQFYGSAQRVANLYVCRESRIETLKSYPLSFSVNYEDPLVPFNFEKDTLLLGRSLLDEESHIYFRKHCDRGDLAKVQRLMVDTKLYWMTEEDEQRMIQKLEEDCVKPRGRDRGTGFGGLSSIVFSGLVEYTALYTHYTDPLPAWAEKSWYPTIPIFPFLRSATTRWEDEYQALKQSWSQFQPLHTIRNHAIYSPLTQRWMQHARYGGITKEMKWDPAIIRWKMPRIACMGLEERVVDAFYD
ncbi:hypothetical protein HYFRA_00008449, partial [Hymenoscyphus fraxineus]